MNLYTTVVTVWKTETEAVHIPVLGVFATKEEAERHAQVVAVYALAEHNPALLERPSTTLAIAQPDESVRALLASVAQQRPDLLPRRGRRAP